MRAGQAVLPRTRPPLEVREQVVEQAGESACGHRRVVEQVRDRTEQVAEQVPRAGLRCDVEHDSIEVHLKPEKVQVEWPKRQVQDRTGSRCCHRDRD